MLWLLWKRPSWRGFYFYFGSRLKVRSSKVVLCLLPAFSSFSAPLFVPSVPFSRMWRAFQTLPARPCVRACVRTRRNVMAAFSGSRVLRSELPPPPLWSSEDSQSFFCCFWTKKESGESFPECVHVHAHTLGTLFLDPSLFHLSGLRSLLLPSALFVFTRAISSRRLPCLNNHPSSLLGPSRV